MEALANWFKERFNSVTLHPKPTPEPEPVRAAARPVTGFFALLTDDQRKAMLAYCGDDSVGAEEFQRR
jgi:hypothetical protein